jgi:hypothetical protein
VRVSLLTHYKILVKESMNKNQKTGAMILGAVVLIALVVIVGVSAKKRASSTPENTAEVVQADTKLATNSLVQEDGLIHPKAPGAWVMSGVKNISPATLMVGENKINANVKGLFADKKVMVKVYDNLTEVASTEAEAVVDPIENDYVAVKTFSVMIPATMQGKTLIVRFIKPGTEVGYWGTTMVVK